MAVTKIKTTSSFTNLTKYDSFLAGNAAYDPGAFVSIASTTGTGSSGTVTFSSIPSTYTSLQLRINGVVDAGGLSWRMRFNGDTASNYNYHNLIGNGTTVSAGNGSGTSIFVNSGTSQITQPTVLIIDIHNYSSTTQNKTSRHITGFDNNSGTTESFIELSSGLWRSTSAIDSVTIFMGANNFTTASRFSLYGIKGA
jgi:hypothetical protein